MTWTTRTIARLGSMAVVALLLGLVAAPAAAQEPPPSTPPPPDAPPPASPWPLEQRGRSSTNVRPLQLLLNGAGQDVVVDGVFGPETEAAVRAVQETGGVAVDGMVGGQTWPLILPPLDQGAQGPAVEALQTKLVVNGPGGPGAQAPDSDDLAVDGVYGPATAAAVTRFQEDIGKPVSDGVDVHTWRELLWHGIND